MSNEPIFYDPGGKRRRVLSRGAIVAIVFSIFLSLTFLVSVLSAPFLPVPPEARRGIMPVRESPVDHDRRFAEARARLVAQVGSEKGARGSKSPPHSPIVAAFYAPWQETGLFSLRANRNRLTHLMPQWLHLTQDGSRVDYTDFDPRNTPHNQDVIDIARDGGIKVFPIFDNSNQGQFDPARAHKFLASPAAQKRLAIELLAWVKKHNFDGINVDLENLSLADYKKLPEFARTLEKFFTPERKGVSFDIEAANPDAPIAELGSICNWIVLMAYDEHSEDMNAGPIASADWSEEVVDHALKSVPAEKLVVGIGNYAYDWNQGKAPAESLTYREALENAAGYRDDEHPEDVINLDETSLNPKFEYTDENGKLHTVWMLDAATAFNKVKLARDRGVRGTALWALGQEDPSIWTFLDRAKLNQPLDPSSLEDIEFPYEISFRGDGEILRVDETPERGSRSIEVDPQTGLITDEVYHKYPSPYVIQRSGYRDKVLALTFDDGPDATFTPKILDELGRLKVPATFFVIGQNAAEMPDLVRREYDQGNEVGSHTYFHPDLGVVTPERTKLELNATQRAIESILGRSTVLFRPPYRADAEPSTSAEVEPIAIAAKLGYITVCEYLDPEDWKLETMTADGPRKRTAEEMCQEIRDQIANEKNQIEKGNIILLHDAGGDRAETIKVLETIVPELQKQGYRFVTVSQLIGWTKDQAMPPVPAKDRIQIWIDQVVFKSVYGLQAFLAIAFILGIALGLARIALITPLAWIYELRRKTEIFPPNDLTVEVTIAAYNESKVIIRTIESVLASTYPVRHVIVVDDGSSDGTGDVVEARFADDPRVQLIRQENTGKAGALNRAIESSDADVLVCVDADTQLKPDAIGYLIRHFGDEAVGAVAGNVRVGNEVNILTKWQSIEYTTSQNLDRRAYALLNAVTVSPGAISAWRRSTLLEVGGYQRDTLAEDMDLTWRVRQRGYEIETESLAIAFTEAPDSIKPFFRQRFRWAYGTLQCLWKHKRALFKYQFFGWLALPSLWVFQVFFQAIAPLVDIQLLLSVYGFLSLALDRSASSQENSPLAGAQAVMTQTLALYLLFLGVEILAGWLAYRMEKRKARSLGWLFLQRFAYRQIMYAVIYRSLLTALNGVRQGWGKLDRKATVRLDDSSNAA